MAVMAVTLFRYDNAGNTLGILPYDSATHDEALDGTDKLTVVSEISPTKRDRLVWQDDGGEWHEHMVDTAKRTHAGNGARTESMCSNSISELYGTIADGTKIRASVSSIMSTLLAGTRWTVGTCDDFGVVEIEVYHKSVRECIAELCELCKGELETVVTVGDSGVTKRVARIVKERGNKAVVRQFQYGRNVSSILREVASDEVYTAVKGYGAKLREDDDSEFPARLEVVAESKADLTRWGVPQADGTYAHNFTTYTDSQCTDRQFLLKQCRSVLASVSKPLVRYEFDTADAGSGLWSDVRLGDKTMCIDELFNPPLELVERVSQIRRNLKGRIQCRIAIGARANPILEQFRAAEKVSRVSTGNPSRITSRSPIRTGGAGYDGEGAPSIGDVDIPTTTEPSSIAVTTPPTKTEYYDGESIDFSGIVVTLYNSDGSVYTDDWHPDGLAAFEELIFPQDVAIGDFSRIVFDDDGNAIVYLTPWPIKSSPYMRDEVYWLASGGRFFDKEPKAQEIPIKISAGAWADACQYAGSSGVIVINRRYAFSDNRAMPSVGVSVFPRDAILGYNVETPPGSSTYPKGTILVKAGVTRYSISNFPNFTADPPINESGYADLYLLPQQVVKGYETPDYYETHGGISGSMVAFLNSNGAMLPAGDDGKADGTVSVPVRWARQDGTELEGSFSINVLDLVFSGDSKTWGGNEGDAPNPWGDPEILYPELYQ